MLDTLRAAPDLAGGDRRAASKVEMTQAFLTLTVAGQLCGVPALSVRDVLGIQAITRIPLAPAEVAGSLNLRGRIVTAIDMRRRLGLPPRDAATPAMNVVVEQGGELYSLVADTVGEVVSLVPSAFDPNPATLDPVWRDVARGVHRRTDEAGVDALLVLLDVERLLSLG